MRCSSSKPERSRQISPSAGYLQEQLRAEQRPAEPAWRVRSVQPTGAPADETAGASDALAIANLPKYPDAKTSMSHRPAARPHIPASRKGSI